MNDPGATPGAAPSTATTVTDGSTDTRAESRESTRPPQAAKSVAAAHVDAKDKAAASAFERLVRQSAKVADAQARARRERDRLDEMIAETVSGEPSSITWYAHRGTLTIDQAVGAIGGGYAGVHQALQRYRKTHTATSTTRRRTAR